MSRRHNFDLPYDDIARELDQKVSASRKFYHNLSGSFTSFYFITGVFENRFYVELPGLVSVDGKDCLELPDRPEEVRYLVTADAVCKDTWRVIKHYPESGIGIYELKNGTFPE